MVVEGATIEKVHVVVHRESSRPKTPFTEDPCMNTLTGKTGLGRDGNAYNAHQGRSRVQAFRGPTSV